MPETNKDAECLHEQHRQRCCSGCVNLLTVEDKPSCIFYEEQIDASDCDMFYPIPAHKPIGVYD
jgi:hypothetical protein